MTTSTAIGAVLDQVGPRLRRVRIVIDCPDPGALARFYGAMLDWKVDVSSDWAEVPRSRPSKCTSM